MYRVCAYPVEKYRLATTIRGLNQGRNSDLHHLNFKRLTAMEHRI